MEILVNIGDRPILGFSMFRVEIVARPVRPLLGQVRPEFVGRHMMNDADPVDPRVLGFDAQVFGEDAPISERDVPSPRLNCRNTAPERVLVLQHPLGNELHDLIRFSLKLRFDLSVDLLFREMPGHQREQQRERYYDPVNRVEATRPRDRVPFLKERIIVRGRFLLRPRRPARIRRGESPLLHQRDTRSGEH